MKWREILQVSVTPQPKGKKVEKQITFCATDKYLIMDIWRKKVNICRHAIDRKTWEYGTYHPDTGIEDRTNLTSCTEGCGGKYWAMEPHQNDWLTEKQIKELDKITKSGHACDWIGDVLKRICRMETYYKADQRERAQNRKEQRIRDLMDKCPNPGKAVYDWITERLVGDLQYAFYNKQDKTCHCTDCNGDFREEAAGVPVKHRKQIKCPLCGHDLTVEKTRANVQATGWLTTIHDVDEKQGVERHFKVTVEWSGKGKRYTELDEQIRLMMLRGAKNFMKIYYYCDVYWCGWHDHNPQNRRWYSSYLYPDTEGIKAGLKDTAYEAWSDVLPMLAQMGIKAHYNGLLVESNSQFTGIAEYMAKGRFYRLLDELSQCITYWGGYSGRTIEVNGECIEDILLIDDRQLINRLRQENGGMQMLRWMQWSELEEKKLSADFIAWTEKNKIDPENYERSIAGEYMSPEQLMNYLNRQKKESYPGMRIPAVWNQYEDYLSMSKTLGKHMDDALVHRPRELKRRHDEVNAEMELHREEFERKRNAEMARKQAQEMRDKYPGYEDILSEVSEKFEYQNDSYCILVPKDFMEITAEGMALHHCVGNTERYFDRIVSRETYICFLRQQSEPDKPFYTIEVEPGGTIRQHRGAYDEEPGIEEIKPFLREWQKVIRKRMSKKDHEYAAQSEILRQKNIEELQAKNNTVVLKGLAEDLMEVI